MLRGRSKSKNRFFKTNNTVFLSYLFVLAKNTSTTYFSQIFILTSILTAYIASMNEDDEEEVMKIIIILLVINMVSDLKRQVRTLEYLKVLLISNQ